MKNEKLLRDEFCKLQTEATTLIDLCAGEKRDLTTEEKTANEARFARMTAIKSALDENARFAALAIAGETTPGKVTLPADPDGKDEFDAANKSLFTPRAGESEDAAKMRFCRQAVNQFLRTGDTKLAAKFALTTATDSGVMLPTVVNPPLIVKRIANPIRAALAARGLMPITTDTTASMSIPVFTDTNDATNPDEDAATDGAADPTVGGITLAATLFDSGTVWASNTLLSSLSFDLLAYLEPMLNARQAAKEIAAWMAKLAAGTVGKTTATVAGVTFAELLDFQHSLPLAQRADAVWFVSDGLLRLIRGMVDDNARPIFYESTTESAPNTLLGMPCFPSTGLDDPAAGKVSGILASASGLVVRDVNNRRLVRYVNIPTYPDQFGTRLFTNSDMGFAAATVRTLKHAAA